MLNNNLIKTIENLEGLEVYKYYSLSKMSSLGLDSMSEIFIEVSNEQALKLLVQELNKENLNYFVLGKGSNIILPKIIKEPVIRLSFEIDREILAEVKESYWLPANTPLNTMTGKAVKHGLKGWEVFTGIPATFGGAIWMNAGTSHGEIGELIKRVKILRSNGTLEEREIIEGDFSYRKNNFLKKGDIILSAEIVHFGQDESISQKIKDYLKKRSISQPLTKKTCGCTFKNVAILPGGNTKSCIAGKIIDIMGLKGLKYKNLVISPVHGNFIENHGNSSQEDFLEFVDMINSRIEKRYGYKLEMEAIVYRDISP